MDTEEIRNEIKRLEGSKTTYPNCSRLAVLYTVLNNAENNDVNAHNGRERIATHEDEYSYIESEFAIACRSTTLDNVIGALDEHMQAVKVLYPKEYAKVLRMLSS